MLGPPAWIESLVDILSECMEAHDMMGPLGFRYREEGTSAEITIYPCPIELLGDKTEGAIVSPGFSIDLERLRSAFERVDGVHWNAHRFGSQDCDGISISVEGRYRGHDVWLCILAGAPDDEEPAMQVDISGSVANGPTKVH